MGPYLGKDKNNNKREIPDKLDNIYIYYKYEMDGARCSLANACLKYVYNLLRMTTKRQQSK
jgi:hypothetical protein